MSDEGGMVSRIKKFRMLVHFLLQHGNKLFLLRSKKRHLLCAGVCMGVYIEDCTLGGNLARANFLTIQPGNHQTVVPCFFVNMVHLFVRASNLGLRASFGLCPWLEFITGCFNSAGEAISSNWKCGFDYNHFHCVSREHKFTSLPYFS